MRPVALITGATRGFGYALAQELQSTHDLLIGGTDPGRVDAVCGEFPGSRPFCADLRHAASLREAAASVGRLDVLVHSAGVAPVGRLETASHADWHGVLELNVVAVGELTALLLPSLRENFGLVVMINSGAGLRGIPDMALYCTSKFALTGLTESLRLAERGRVRVLSVHPGQMDTDMQRGMAVDRGVPYQAEDHMRPEDVARLVAEAIVAPPSLTVSRIEVAPS